MKKLLVLFSSMFILFSCQNDLKKENTPMEEPAFFRWDAASVYFLLTDRFKNGDESNDQIIAREEKTGVARGFEGGDFRGIIDKLEDNYFTDLGINVIWLTPVWEQIHSAVDEGTGATYGFHGYWAKDWTKIEPSYGTQEELIELIDLAHNKQIRVMMDVVINHTGPVTALDPVWPQSWVLTAPTCTYTNQETAVSCTLTNNLPDILTSSEEVVTIPQHLADKWKKENRYDQEIQELEDFFKSSELKATPVNHIIKWVTDYARETGVDAFRIDTVKHVEEQVWQVFNDQSRKAHKLWKENNPNKVWTDDDFFIMGELYGYEVSGGRSYPFSDVEVDYFNYGYDGMINFGFKRHAVAPFKMLFDKYDGFKKALTDENSQQPATFMNYISSHDDGEPYDPQRIKSLDAATKLLLTSGISQIYYGDERDRKLQIDGAVGDANLRSSINWKETDSVTLNHWQRLGRYRRDHVAIGAGQHTVINSYGRGLVFSRILSTPDVDDAVIAAVGITDKHLSIKTSIIFPKEKKLRNAYNGNILVVKNGRVKAQVENGTVLLEKVD